MDWGDEGEKGGGEMLEEHKHKVTVKGTMWDLCVDSYLLPLCDNNGNMEYIYADKKD